MTSVKKHRSIISLMLGIITILAMVAPTAAVADAKSPAIALFRGRAVINADTPIAKNTKGECLKGDGLNAPVTQDHVPSPTAPFAPAENACYHFEAPSLDTVESRCTALVWNTPTPNVEDCAIEATGNVGAVGTPKGTQLGAWCGLSAGWNGSGSVTTFGAGTKAGTFVTLKDLGWPPTAGGLLPVTGRWFDPTDPGKKGAIVALVQASGSNNFGDPLLVACLSNNGAHAFDVNAISVLL